SRAPLLSVSSIGYIRAGRLRALAETAATRSEALPGIPTVGEFVPGYEASNWFGMGAPKATSAEIVEKLNKETPLAYRRTLRNAQSQERLDISSGSRSGKLRLRRLSKFLQRRARWREERCAGVRGREIEQPVVSARRVADIHSLQHLLDHP